MPNLRSHLSRWPSRWFHALALAVLATSAAAVDVPTGGPPIQVLQGVATVDATTSTSTCHNWTSPPDTPNCAVCVTQICGIADCADSFVSDKVDNTNLDGQRQSTDNAPSSDPVQADVTTCTSCGDGGSGGGGGGIISQVSAPTPKTPVSSPTQRTPVATPSALSGVSTQSRLPTWGVQRIQRPNLLGSHSSLGPGGFLDLDGSLTFQGASTAVVFLPQQHSPISLQLQGTSFVDTTYASCRGMVLYDHSGAVTTVTTQAVTAVLTTWEGNTYTFELPPTLGAGRLIRRADRNDNATTVQYVYAATMTPPDPALLWEMASSTDAYGRTTTYRYASSPISGSYPITQITTPDGHTTTYQYGGNGLTGLAGIGHTDGSSSSFSSHVDTASQCQVWSLFDASSAAGDRRQDYYLSLGEHVDPSSGQVIDVAPNRVRMIANGAGEVTYMSWATLTPQFDQQAYVYEGGNSLFRFTTFLGNPVCSERALMWDLASDPSTWSWTLDEAFRVDANKYFVVSGDGLGRTTLMPVDLTNGTRPGATYPDGSTISTSFNGFREPLQQVDELGRITQWTYDTHGNRLSMTVAVGTSAQATTSWTYNSHGQPLSKTDANGHTTTYAYDAIGQLIHVTEPPDVVGGTPAIWSFGYDAAGNHITTIDPDGRAFGFAYDARNRLIAKTYADGSSETWTYGSGDLANLVIASTDRNGNVTQYSYDAAGREVTRTLAVGSPVQDVVTTTYLPGTDLPATITSLGDTTAYTYDYGNRLLSTTVYPTVDTALTTTEAFDQAEQDVITTDAYGRRTERAFDARGRVVRTAEEVVPGALPQDEDLVAGLPDPTELPWNFQSLGSPVVPGSIAFNGDTISITDQGIEMWSDTEQFSLYDQDLVGDGSITVRVASLSDTNPWAKAGVMLRSSDAVGAAYAALFTSPGYGISVNDRASPSLDTSYEPVAAAAPNPPCWLRLVRIGTNILSYTSVDGVAWTLGSQTTVGGGSRVRIGLFVLAHETSTPCTATFDHLTVEHLPQQSPLMLLALTQDAVRSLDRSLPNVVITDMTYDAAGQAVTETDPRGISTTHSYDGQGRMVATTFAAGTALAATNTITYDPVGNQVMLIDPLGRVTTAIFSQRDLELSWTQAAGTPVALTTSYTYTPTQKVATETTPLGTVGYAYCACCDRLHTVTDQLGYSTNYTYDPNGNVTSITDGNGLTTVYAFDARDRLASSTNAAGETTTYTYDDHVNDGQGLDPSYHSVCADLRLGPGADGSMTLTTDPLGHATLVIYDGIGREMRHVDALLHATTTSYDRVVAGLVDTSTTDPVGNTVQSLADSHRLVREVIDAQGQITSSTYDADDNPLSTRDPNGVGDDWTYDALNRRTTVTNTAGLTTTWSYDLDNNLIAQTDPLGAVTSLAYDALNRRISTTDRNGETSRFSYDPVGNLASITDAQGSVTTYLYDARSLLLKEILPGTAGGSKSYSHDGGRRLISRTDPSGTVTTYQYDAANRLLVRGYADHLNDTYSFDHAGRLITASSSRYDNQLMRVYDAADRLTNEGLSVVANPIRHTKVRYDVYYGYDNANRLTLLSYPDGKQVRRQYTPRNQLASVTYNQSLVVSRTYDPGGRMVMSRAGNGVQESRTYRSDNLVQSIVAPGVTHVSYVYDADQRTLTESNLILPQRSQHFTYDADGRLNHWSEGSGPQSRNQSWNLSPVDDWQQTTINGVVQRRAHNAVHEITAIDGMPLSSDPNGNLVQDPLHSLHLGWDPENRLVQATHGGQEASYSYDALGRRVRKVVGAVTTTFVHAGLQDVWETDTDEAVFDQFAANGGPPRPDLPLGGVMSGTDVLRIAFAPAAAVPAGFDGDSGATIGLRSDGQTYGWVGSPQPYTTEYDIEPLPPFNGNDAMQMSGTPNGTWGINLADGSYPVVVVMGDPAHRDMHNDVTVGGISCQDPNPDVIGATPGYDQGRFVGYAVQVTVSNGRMVISPQATAYNARICFIEIGPAGSHIDAHDQARLQRLVSEMIDATATTPPKLATRSYIFGSYLDEVLAIEKNHERYYLSSNRLFSPVALTDAHAHVVERYTYSAYGDRTVLRPDGTIRSNTSSFNPIGFTGRYIDAETGLLDYRNRMLSPGLGRFLNRDPLGYVDGYNLYAAYFVPGMLDPFGTQVDPPPPPPPPQPQPQPAPEPTPVPHGNSNASQAAQHTYDIYDEEGNLYKTGISGQPLNKNGTSPRANEQVNKLNQNGRNYRAKVTNSNVQGNSCQTARQRAKQLEQERVNKYAKANGGKAPPGNKLPKPSPGAGAAAGEEAGAAAAEGAEGAEAAGAAAEGLEAGEVVEILLGLLLL